MFYNIVFMFIKYELSICCMQIYWLIKYHIVTFFIANVLHFSILFETCCIVLQNLNTIFTYMPSNKNFIINWDLKSYKKN